MTDLATFLTNGTAVVRLHLETVRGSSPRAAGTEMYVSATGYHGTIGGGQLEYMAIDHARAMLLRGDDHAQMDVPLGPEIGQCCGGRVLIDLSRMDGVAIAQAISLDNAARDAFAPVLIFGAGHVGRALASVLSLLPVKPVLIDSRAEELALCTTPIEKRLSPLPESEVRSAAKGSAYVVLTHDHGLDFLLTSEALARGDASYVGMIGSATKRASFKSWCRRHMAHVDLTPLVCPMGRAGLGDKRPEVIANFVASEVLVALSQYASQPLHTLSD